MTHATPIQSGQMTIDAVTVIYHWSARTEVAE